MIVFDVIRKCISIVIIIFRCRWLDEPDDDPIAPVNPNPTCYCTNLELYVITSFNFYERKYVRGVI